MDRKTFRLTTETTFKTPDQWQVQARFALGVPGKEISLPAGTWLLELAATEDSQTFRLAGGRVVLLNHPLTGGEAEPLDDPQAVLALASFRTLEEAARQEWGVELDFVHNLPPFQLIKCPLCWATRFISADFAVVWCDDCNATFVIRHTAGDPGFVVNCQWEHYRWACARYLMPRTPSLVLTMVLKDSSDPRDMASQSWCHYNGCTPEQVRLIRDESSLRPGLHACQVDTLFGWSLNGRAPSGYDASSDGYATLHWPDRKEGWPASAYVRASGLSHEERRSLQGIGRLLEEGEGNAYRQSLLRTRAEVANQPPRPPYVAYRATWPDAGRLGSEEKCLLHSWDVTEQKQYSFHEARPRWIVVAPAGERAWRVVREGEPEQAYFDSE